MNAAQRLEVVRRGSCLADPPDHRDRPFGAVSRYLSSPPPAIPRLPTHNPFDQLSLGSCVAQAIVMALYTAQRARGAMPPHIASRLAVYYLARATHGMQRYDSGTYNRAGFWALNHFGFAPERLWPYQIRRFAQMPPTRLFWGAFDQSAKRAVVEYRRITSRGLARCHEIRLALAAGWPVVFGLDIDERFMVGRQDLWTGPTSPIVGGHAMMWGGYNEVGPEAINSWGAKWSGDGWFRMTWQAAGLYPRDLWAVRLAPLYSQS